MSFGRVYDLYIDTALPGGPNCLLRGTAGTPRTDNPSWVTGDTFTLRLHFRQVGSIGSTTTAVALGTGDELVLAAKVSLSATTLLYSAVAWTKVVAGDDIYYQAELDLNTVELLAAVTGGTLDTLVDVEVQNADNTARMTFRFSAVIVKAVYQGEGDPTPGTPAFPSPSALMVKNPAGGSYRLKDGNLQFYNPTTLKFHTLFPSGPEESVVSNWGPGES